MPWSMRPERRVWWRKNLWGHGRVKSKKEGREGPWRGKLPMKKWFRKKGSLSLPGLWTEQKLSPLRIYKCGFGVWHCAIVFLLLRIAWKSCDPTWFLILCLLPVSLGVFRVVPILIILKFQDNTPFSFIVPSTWPSYSSWGYSHICTVNGLGS